MDSFTKIVLFCMYFETNWVIKSLISPKMLGLTLKVEAMFDKEWTSLMILGWLRVLAWSQTLLEDKVDLIKTLKVSSVSLLALNHYKQYPMTVMV